MSEGKPIREIGDKIRAVQESYYIEEDGGRLHTVWIPKIQVDGQMMGIYDDSTKSGQKEAGTRRDALKIAKQVRDETKERLAQKLANTV